ncbi:13819_t:CDS:2, partial [Acaulospora colombiana]
RDAYEASPERDIWALSSLYIRHTADIYFLLGEFTGLQPAANASPFNQSRSSVYRPASPNGASLKPNDIIIPIPVHGCPYTSHSPRSTNPPHGIGRFLSSKAPLGTVKQFFSSVYSVYSFITENFSCEQKSSFRGPPLALQAISLYLFFSFVVPTLYFPFILLTQTLRAPTFLVFQNQTDWTSINRIPKRNHHQMIQLNKSALLVLLLPLCAHAHVAPYKQGNVERSLESSAEAALQRVWEGIKCMGECRKTWGWQGNHFGADPWGGVLNIGDPLPYDPSQPSTPINNDSGSRNSQSASSTTSSTEGGFGILDVTTAPVRSSTTQLAAPSLVTLPRVTTTSSEQPSPTPEPEPETTT